MRRQYQIVGIGELLWDILPNHKRLGGAPANYAIQCRALGANTHIISTVGNDSDGKNILKLMGERGINRHLIKMNQHSTGVVRVSLDTNGHPSYTINENSAWDYIELSDHANLVAHECDAVCFGTLAQRNPVSRKAIHDFLSMTPDQCFRVFDINLRQNYFSKDIIEQSLIAANILKLNQEEYNVLHRLLGLPAREELGLRLLQERYNLKCIALTRGAEGSVMMNSKDFVYSPSTVPIVQDTIGAGDAFTAAMTIGLLHGASLGTINRLAGRVAAYVCSQAGATPELPLTLIREFHRIGRTQIKDIDSIIGMATTNICQPSTKRN